MRTPGFVTGGKSRAISVNSFRDVTLERFDTVSSCVVGIRDRRDMREARDVVDILEKFRVGI